MEGEPRESPEHFGPYILLSELGRGGQGSVWLAEDSRLSRRVALKLLNTGPGSISDHQLARFQREAEAANKLDHPNICGLLDAGDVDGVPYLAFRHVQGESLADRIDRAARAQLGSSMPELEGEANEAENDPSTRAGIHRIALTFEKIARALHKAHEAGLIHRDVKPGNIMITDEGEPMVLDFGLAREEIGDEQSLTHSGDLLGTPAYMSPEQLMANRVPLDRRTDIYSLGASLYEALSLRRPFEALTRAELYQQILHAIPESLSSVNRQIPRDLQVVVETAMERDRNRRYQTALDLAEDLRRSREFEPIRARPVGRLLRVRRWAQRHPAATVAMLLLSAGLVASLVVVSRISDQLRTEQMHNLVAESTLLLAVDPVLALEKAMHAHKSKPSARAPFSQINRVLAHGVPTAAVADAGWAGGMGSWSRDGKRFLHFRGERSGYTGSVKCRDADAEGFAPRFEGKRIEKRNCWFSSSGTYLYAVDDKGRLHVFNEESKRPEDVDCPLKVETVQALAADDRLLIKTRSRSLAIYDPRSRSLIPSGRPARLVE